MHLIPWIQWCSKVYHWTSHLEKPIILMCVHLAAVTEIRMIVQVVCLGTDPRKYWQESGSVRQGRKKNNNKITGTLSSKLPFRATGTNGTLVQGTFQLSCLRGKGSSVFILQLLSLTDEYSQLEHSVTQGQKSLQLKSHRCWKPVVNASENEVLSIERMSA